LVAISCSIERDPERRRMIKAALVSRWLERGLARPRLGEAQSRGILTWGRKHEEALALEMVGIVKMLSPL
jgi:hypothetical protein